MKSKIKGQEDVDGLFKGLGNLLDLVSRMTEDGKEEYIRVGQATALDGKVRGVYGFSIRVGFGGPACR